MASTREDGLNKSLHPADATAASPIMLSFGCCCSRFSPSRACGCCGARNPRWSGQTGLGYPVLPAVYVAAAGLIWILLLRYKPEHTWPGLIVVLPGLPVYFIWRRKTAI
jgi:hypothetical protein